ncbi:B3 domain-containing protein REM16-like [Prosopis cineraria]|uniref:B3 domain-containing protein REM16-like n=1 Tax=Prosopis cineraria TaxID=364024 RepID=UPI0024107F7E|nr:B3 domain-containing protein REM16-like [Prosopis cineraria]
MAQTSRSSRSWVDGIYWNHFKFTHFAHRLPPGFDQHLALPKRFSDSLKRKLPDNVTLKGPGGAEWTVRLSTRDDVLHFTDGWQQFAQDHFLEESDLLIFKYNGESQFDVLIFDQKNLCEKVASYFVRDSGLTNKRNKDNCLEEENIPSDSKVKVASPKKSAHGKSKKTRKATVERTPAQQTKRRGRSNRSDAHAGEIDWLPDVEPASTSRNKMVEVVDASSRRAMIDNAKKNTLQLAQAACTPDGFYVVMRPSHVYRRFYVTIPTKWMTEHFPLQSEDVILRVGESEWLAKYTFEATRHTGGLASGWKQFAVDNNLQEFDVCVFNLAGLGKKPLTLEVKIFRVDV